MSRELRFLLPQAVTGSRALLGLCLLFLICDGKLYTAAAIWLYGLSTDLADGALARRLGVSSRFGHMADLFADYLYHVLVPAVMSFHVIGESPGVAGLLILSLPGPCAAIRYARMAALEDTESPGIPASAGLGTIAYGLYIVALVFFRREGIIEAPAIAGFVLAGTAILSMLMPSRVRYPKLGAYPWIAWPILAGLMVMPFFQTERLLWLMLGLIVSYVLLAPLLVDQHPERRGAGQDRIVVAIK